MFKKYCSVCPRWPHGLTCLILLVNCFGWSVYKSETRCQSIMSTRILLSCLMNWSSESGVLQPRELENREHSSPPGPELDMVTLQCLPLDVFKSYHIQCLAFVSTCMSYYKCILTFVWKRQRLKKTKASGHRPVVAATHTVSLLTCFLRLVTWQSTSTGLGQGTHFYIRKIGCHVSEQTWKKMWKYKMDRLAAIHPWFNLLYDWQKVEHKCIVPTAI